MESLEPIYSSLSSDLDYQDLVRDFVNEIPLKRKMLDGFVAKGDLPQLHRMIHQLRGSCGGYGFPSLTEAASEIDEALKKGATMEEIMPRLGNFLTLLTRAKTAPEQA